MGGIDSAGCTNRSAQSIHIHIMSFCQGQAAQTAQPHIIEFLSFVTLVQGRARLGIFFFMFCVDTNCGSGGCVWTGCGEHLVEERYCKGFFASEVIVGMLQRW